MKTYSVLYFGCALLAILVAPLVSRMARHFGLVDKPGVRKVHKDPVPRIGGIVFVLPVLAMTLPVFFLDNSIGQAFRSVQGQLITLLACGVFLFAIGFIDDVVSLSAKIKLIALVAAAGAVCASGARIQSVGVSEMFDVNFGWMSWPVTAIWIVGITVGMNFIDGLDGLAAGIAAIVCGTIAILAWHSGQIAMVALMVALMGSITGFLFFNFHPAKMFMGDGGAMFLGFMVSAGSVVCRAKSATLVGVALPALVLGVPIIDTLFTMIRRRILDRRSIFAAERGHLHHRLLDKGLQQQTVVFIIYGVTLVAAGASVLTMSSRGSDKIMVMAGGAVFLFTVFAMSGTTRICETFHAIKRNKKVVRQKKVERDVFEDAQLRVREANTFDAWWRTACRMAEDMEIDRLAISYVDGPESSTSLAWRRTEDELSPLNVANVTFDIAHPGMTHPMRLEMAVRRNGSWELSGRRAVFFSRLIDERPIPLPSGIASAYLHQTDAPPVVAPLQDVPAPVDVMGIPVTPFESYDHAVNCIADAIDAGRKSFWVAINPQKIYRAGRDDRLLKILQNDADVGICDGVGVSVASRILYRRFITRCTGCDLFFALVAAAERKNWRVFMLGAEAESNRLACVKLQEKHPDLQIVGRQDGYFDNSADVVAKINASGADMLFIAMGTPTQEYWISEHRRQLRPLFCMGVGGSFNVAAGTVRRAPKIFQKMGAEFIYQLMMEPKRIKRQIVYAPYMISVLKERFFGSSRSVDDEVAENSGRDGEYVSERMIEKFSEDNA